MENTNSSSTTKAPTLCTAGCGFYGSEAFNNMCSQCFKAQNKNDNNSTTTAIATAATTADKSKTLPQIARTKTSSPPKTTPSTPTFNDNSIPIAAGKSRKHLRSPSPNGPRMRSAPASSIASPVPSTTSSSTTDTNATTNAETSTTNPSDKPVQLNKGRCFKCRSKVPLAKQAANKCRCSYVFCDSHRYPDRHDCDIDYAKMDREILAKNNPKLLTRRRYQEI
ncbi:TFIIH/NER complex subunit [Mucor velutinosus]|uniref:TFIIH/NER complex subunit n=1 Tax=Mucor velutinosus TaxID=708070 RepID=A0AAN7I3X6_9FUNG|nr:TFIIH/NER complex subunit [Mucor velutinosus]